RSTWRWQPLAMLREVRSLGRSCRAPRFGVCDIARAHPAQDLTRGLDRGRVPARWPVAELFFELVCDPPRLIATLLGYVSEHAVPSIFLDLVIVDDGSAALDEAKLASGGRNELRRALGQEAAVGTRLAADTQRAALRAFNELALVAALPLRMLGSSSS